ncbi:MAG: hypothetical protein BJ554DRAFT_4111 [Olpidium bornovanus]|uniref:Uncharacterized protein n=1 Tax=Olpidium bornovanus TaxID=278681 RepID=A0A8H8A045_9FUNG|nr:MAG: hypothetical protein BJ554DRAFT_4111 [Olpidium bornovanus]
MAIITYLFPADSGILRPLNRPFERAGRRFELVTLNDFSQIKFLFWLILAFDLVASEFCLGVLSWIGSLVWVGQLCAAPPPATVSPTRPVLVPSPPRTPARWILDQSVSDTARTWQDATAIAITRFQTVSTTKSTHLLLALGIC